MARWVSILAHPFVMIGVLVGVAAERLSSPGEALRSVALVSLFTIVPLGILMVRQVRRGEWENVDASNSRERPLLYVVATGALIALLGYLLAVRAESFLLRGAAGTLALLAVCAVATRWVKISLHLAFAGLAATALFLLASPAGWFLALLVPALAWSRLTLGRHAPVELAAGLALGVAAGVAINVA